jgi:hypothetical protein
MRQVNKREKKQLWQREKLKFICAHSEIRTHGFAYTLSVIPARHHILHGKYVNLLYIYRLFLATAIYDCVNMYTVIQ